ncbi:MAG: hypothetical protein R2874_16145 [Desulfobacterales bacterium]
MNFVSRVKRFYDIDAAQDPASDDELYQFRVSEAVTPYETEITIPKKFQHVNLEAVYHSETRVEELVAVVKKYTPGHRCITGFQRLMWSGSYTSNGFPNTLAIIVKFRFYRP